MSLKDLMENMKLHPEMYSRPALKEPTMTPNPTPSRTNNTLSHPEVYRLTRWVDENQASLKGKTQEQIAKDASASTGLTVTVSNIRGVAETLGILLSSWSGKSPGMASKDTSRTLARCLCELYSRLGETAPPAVQAIAKR